jgi:murein DD-endopeptidase MepM/ murein hydrolase activator NlpD
MSTRDDRLAIAIGAGMLLAMALRKESDGIDWGGGWHFPVPDLVTKDGKRYAATVSQGFHAPAHFGVDIMYKRTSVADRADFPAGVVDAGGARQHTMWFSPPGTPILAARDARVWAVLPNAHGIAVVLDHGAPWATFYQHLASTTLEPHAAGKRKDGKPATVVKAGEQIGVMGHSPLDGEKLRHLHFATWYKGNGDKASVDPATVMQTWARSSWRL